MDRPNAPIDAVALARDLIRCPSVTPADAGALGVLEDVLAPRGFACERMTFSAENTPDVDNLYARFGTAGPHLCFAGHSDVVPPGDHAGWSVDPFEARVEDGLLIGRGASDMKSAIAAFAAAAADFAPRLAGKGSISLLITGDEEGPSLNGTVKMLGRLAERNERIDHCVVGEPTSQRKVGDTLKIGRRGSCTGYLRVLGAQGHVAYPHKADNPIPKLVAILAALTGRKLDEGTDHFEPSNLEVTTVDVGNPATNVIPAAARAVFNIRHNDLQNAPDLERWVRSVCDAVMAAQGGAYELEWVVGGDCFITQPGDFTALLSAAAEDVTGAAPEFSTGGGTSDARFIKNYCPVAELGLVGETMHKADERVDVADIVALRAIYTRVLERYFATDGA
jgi:succinyl-diaminopimelate desuccinylase